MLDHRSGFVRSHGWLGERSNLPWASKMDLLDLLEQNVAMPRRYLVWLKPPGTQICMRLESCFLDLYALGERQGQIRSQKRAWEMFLWTSLTYYVYIYIVHFHGVHLFDYSQWFCLWRAKPLGYPADDVDCLLAGQMATAEAPCHCQKIHRQCRQCDCITVPNAHVSSVTWIYLLPRWFERWI